ncbi:CHAT domain-containing protein [Sphaerotilus sp.]|uniref:CHAT domain-containing protein n=1 Tax=Sphaerotilus sp. TaxID=2093942 RepID=UPI002ACDB180|nr:CHAT domain-containing protein [Sphaerotilus sp.]MDZ7855685.1 CHAT domain-containing protein [Sphaerotilus sp.]
MKATIEILGDDVYCRADNAARSERRLDGATARGRLQAWARAYDEAVARHDAGAAAVLQQIGTEMWQWLDEDGGWASAWANEPEARCLDILVDQPRHPLADALLDAPWELLVQEGSPLAADTVQVFEVVRRLAAAGSPWAALHRDLQMLFMAAAPDGEHVLSFESEESAILQATRGAALHLLVEESGALEPLQRRLADDKPFEVLHLSCHGTIDAKRGPLLALEDDGGRRSLVDAGQLSGALGGGDRPPLVFLSACRTAEQVTAQTRPAGGVARVATPVESMVRSLVRSGIAHVLGWDGSVYDRDARAYAEAFYRQLSLANTVPHAAARARTALLVQHRADPRTGQHWHLARLYVGAHGGSVPLIDRRRPAHALAGGANDKAFLDDHRQRVPVAGRSAFVGRRRVMQAVFRAFRAFDEGTTSGVLLHGMGNLGKSSVAARIASRLARHRVAVVFGRYDALEILDRVQDCLPRAMEVREAKARWREEVQADPTALADALEDWLTGWLNDQPILLVIDDLEQVLTPPRAEEAGVLTEVKHPQWRAALLAVLQAFDRVSGRTASRLLLTSRYVFRLADERGGDLAARLTRVPLQPMNELDREKQLAAAERLLTQPAQDSDALQRLKQQALDLAAGNPGLQETLTRPLLAGEVAAAERALAAITFFNVHGQPPEALRARLQQHVPGAAQASADSDNALLDFFHRMAFEVYRDGLTPNQARALQSATLFDTGVPIPRPALDAVAAAAGVTGAAAALDRLIHLGLLDDFGQLGGAPAPQAAVNPLARPLCPALPESEVAALSAAALEPLDRLWRTENGAVPQDTRALCFCRLALAAPAPAATLLNRVAEAAARVLFSMHHDASRAMASVLTPAHDKLAALGATASHGLSHITVDCANRLGKHRMKQDATRAMQATATSPQEQAAAVLYQARLLKATEPEESLRQFTHAVTLFLATDMDREAAIAHGEIADILQSRGQLDEALRIRLEEQLPVYERLGDVREKAVTQGKIADILQLRGQLDEALRILQAEVLSAFERLGDVRSKAVTQGKIADILQSRGQLDEALRIRLEEQLPVYERLGDVRSKAVTQGKIADILQSRGQLDEALALHLERLPVAQRLGDIDSLAHIRFRTALLRLQRGDHVRDPQALQGIHDELAEAFGLSLKLQRPDFIAPIGACLAQVLAVGGLPEEALTVLDTAEGGFRTMGDTNGIAEIHQLRQQIRAASAA